MNQIKTGVDQTELMLPEYERYEVMNGDLKEIDTEMMGLLHTIIIDNLLLILKPFAIFNKLGLVHGDGVKYVLLISQGSVQIAYKPDIGFLRKGRIPSGFDLYRQPFPGAPDLAVEVISAGQGTPEMLDKVANYLKYGTQEVWVIYPMQRELHRYQSGEIAPEIYNDEESNQSGLFPGLTLKIADLFFVEEA